MAPINRGMISFRDPGYQHSAYVAEMVVQHQLEMEDRLLGWASYEDMERFHARFATWEDAASLRAGDKRSVASGYYPHQHYVRLLPRTRHVLSYTHEVAHSLEPNRGGPGNGHDPEWAGRYIGLLERIDPYAAKLLRKTFKQRGLAVASVVLP